MALWEAHPPSESSARMEGNAQEEGGPLRWHMSRSRQRWVRTESASLEWRLDQGPPSSMGLPMCHRGMNKFRGSSPDHVPPPSTLLSYPGLCVVPHLEHIITHHTIPHVASPSPGPPLGSEAPLLPPLLAACGVTCISASASPPA